MKFVVLDSKKECLGYYYDGKINDNPPENTSTTWDYRHHHHDDKYEYASLYVKGKSLTDSCPDYMKPEWDKLQEQKKAYQNAITKSRINIDDVCAFDLIPEWFLREMSQAKCDIIKHVVEEVEKPITYDFTLQLEKLFGEIRQNTLNLDMESVKDRMLFPSAQSLMQRIKKADKSIQYSQFGSITGRLVSTKSSFPILNLHKSFRKMVKPNNDFFIEFDYNAAELRTLLALSGEEQPQEDMHTWNMKNIFSKEITRDEAKRKIFAALYNPKSKQKYYKIEEVVAKHYSAETVSTPFYRTIKADRHHALNYLLQSTTSDLVLEQVLKVNDLLKGKRSKIVFLIHDSFVLDMAAEDRYTVPEIKKIFSENRFGKYLVGVKAGKDFDSMKEINL